MLELSPPSFISITRRRLASCLAVFAVLLLTALPLHAHHLPPGMEDLDEFEDGAAFMAGLRHPMLGLDHWLFAALVGALAVTAARGGRRPFALPLTMLAAIAAGGLMGFSELRLPALQFSQVLTLAVLALLILGKNRLHPAVQFGLVGLAALYQGNDHGLAWPLDAASGAYLGGVVFTTLVLAQAGAAVTLAAQVLLPSRRTPAMASL